MHVGDELRQQREKLGLSLEEISARTKVSVARLSAIETMDVEGLPVLTYLKGFVRTYAAEIALNPDDITERYLAELDIVGPLEIIAAPQVAGETTPIDRLDDFPAEDAADAPPIAHQEPPRLALDAGRRIARDLPPRVVPERPTRIAPEAPPLIAREDPLRIVPEAPRRIASEDQPPIAREPETLAEMPLDHGAHPRLFLAYEVPEEPVYGRRRRSPPRVLTLAATLLLAVSAGWLVGENYDTIVRHVDSLNLDRERAVEPTPAKTDETGANADETGATRASREADAREPDSPHAAPSRAVLSEPSPVPMRPQAEDAARTGADSQMPAAATRTDRAKAQADTDTRAVRAATPTTRDDVNEAPTRERAAGRTAPMEPPPSDVIIPGATPRNPTTSAGGVSMPGAEPGNAPARSDRPSRPAEERSSDAPDVSGSWMLTNRIDSSSVAQFEEMNLGFQLQLQQKGTRVTGTGRKWMENGRPLPPSRRTPISVEGTITGDRLELTFTEQGANRSSAGTFALELTDQDTLSGRFASGAANSEGTSHARRTQSPRQ